MSEEIVDELVEDVLELELTEEQINAILNGLEEDTIDDVEDVLFNDRNIYLNGEISEETAEYIIPLLHYYNIRDRQNEVDEPSKNPIKLHINTDGGCLHSSLLISQEIRNSKTPVIAICNGKAFSGGFMIFMSSKHREMGDFASLMYHEARTGPYGVSGTFEEIGRSMSYYTKLQKVFDNMIIEGSNITQEQLDEHKGKISDWFIDKELALELGIVEK